MRRFCVILGVLAAALAAFFPLGIAAVSAEEPIHFVANTKPPDAFLALRTDPTSKQGRRIMEMPNGTQLRVLERRNDGWWHVRVVASNTDGWALSGQGGKSWISCCISAPQTATAKPHANVASLATTGSTASTSPTLAARHDAEPPRLSPPETRPSLVAATGRRVALVIGNSKYLHVQPLANAANDARLIAETLRALSFTLVGGGEQVDLDKATLDNVVQQFGRQLIGADVGLFYYAGHGMQVRDTNYLVPVGANPTREADLDFQMLNAGSVLRQMESSGTKLNLVVLDACRNNPFLGRGLRSSGGGLAQMVAPEGTLISYATQPGAVALDGDSGNSPYTTALAQTMRRPGLDIFQTFNEVGLTVKRATRGSQQPWVSSSPIDGAFYFAPPQSTGSR